MITILISATFRGATLIRGAALIRGNTVYLNIDKWMGILKKSNWNNYLTLVLVNINSRIIITDL